LEFHDFGLQDACRSLFLSYEHTTTFQTMFSTLLPQRFAENNAKTLRKINEHHRRALWARAVFRALTPVNDPILNPKPEPSPPESPDEQDLPTPHYEQRLTEILADLPPIDPIRADIFDLEVSRITHTP
jgi:hypothetical protein